MNLSLRIARRYLFSKKSTSAINIITGIAMLGVAVGTAALILVLSVFNGFEDLFMDLFDNFNPDVAITAKRGKTFEPTDTLIAKIEAVPGVAVISHTLEEVALFEYRDKSAIGRLKGVDERFIRVNRIDSIIREGEFRITNGSRSFGVVGNQMVNNLGIDVTDEFSSITVYMPRASQRRTLLMGGGRQFNTKYIFPSGTFLGQQDLDNQYILADLELARELMEKPNEVSALEIRLAPGFLVPETLEAIQAAAGPDLDVRDRYEQEAAFLRLMKIEKWISFAIVGLMILLVSFNIIGALWMIVLEKTPDISILKGMGYTDGGIHGIFVRVGLLLCTTGLLVGFVIALITFALQRSVGLITLPVGSLLDAYPVSLRWGDFLIVTGLVIAIGYLASLLPANRAKRVPAIIHEE